MGVTKYQLFSFRIVLIWNKSKKNESMTSIFINSNHAVFFFLFDCMTMLILENGKEVERIHSFHVKKKSRLDWPMYIYKKKGVCLERTKLRIP